MPSLMQTVVTYRSSIYRLLYTFVSTKLCMHFTYIRLLVCMPIDRLHGMKERLSYFSDTKNGWCT